MFAVDEGEEQSVAGKSKGEGWDTEVKVNILIFGKGMDSSSLLGGKREDTRMLKKKATNPEVFYIQKGAWGFILFAFIWVFSFTAVILPSWQTL